MPSKTGFQLADNTVTALSSLDALWARVDAARAKSLPSSVRPAGSFTTDEYAAKYGLNRETARSQLARFVNAGVFDRHRVIDVANDGRNCVMNVYTVVK